MNVYVEGVAEDEDNFTYTGKCIDVMCGTVKHKIECKLLSGHRSTGLY